MKRNASFAPIGVWPGMQPFSKCIRGPVPRALGAKPRDRWARSLAKQPASVPACPQPGHVPGTPNLGPALPHNRPDPVDPLVAMAPPRVDQRFGCWWPAGIKGPAKNCLTPPSRPGSPRQSQHLCRFGPPQSHPSAALCHASQGDPIASPGPSSRQHQPGDEWTIRSMRRQEAKTVAILQAQAFHTPAAIKPLDGLLYFLFQAEVLDSLLVKLHYNPSDMFAVLVAESPLGAILGVVEVSVQSDPAVLGRMPDATSYAYVSSMAVQPADRRRGLGSALLSAAEAVAEGWGEGPLALHVYSDNEGAVRLYAGAGYREVARERRMGLLPLGPEAPSRILMRKETEASMEAQE
ncbi:unnamed protein product [Ostreobium quekettii]|uniref:N-acetyltransferase domain-containing protein n=1 Tax=Ostreobium quekettii TaxID=121088 RepID=A0A8S1ITI8_9CHLO|nr:unnamed protein product [Ostreobium quekettii]